MLQQKVIMTKKILTEIDLIDQHGDDREINKETVP